jgi:hypothetical protein
LRILLILLWILRWLLLLLMLWWLCIIEIMLISRTLLCLQMCFILSQLRSTILKNV